MIKNIITAGMASLALMSSGMTSSAQATEQQNMIDVGVAYETLPTTARMLIEVHYDGGSSSSPSDKSKWFEVSITLGGNPTGTPTGAGRGIDFADIEVREISAPLTDQYGFTLGKLNLHRDLANGIAGRLNAKIVGANFHAEAEDAGLFFDIAADALGLASTDFIVNGREVRAGNPGLSIMDINTGFGLKTQRDALKLRWEIAHLDAQMDYGTMLVDIYSKLKLVMNEMLDFSLSGGWRSVESTLMVKDYSSSYGYVRVGMESHF